MKELNKRFKEYRVYLNISQDNLSQQTGVSVYTIKNFERGSDIKVSTLEKLLNALGIKDFSNELIPDITDRPSYRSKQYKIKKRAHKVKEASTEWKWGN